MSLESVSIQPNKRILTAEPHKGQIASHLRSNQKYSLQRRDSRGFFEKVATFTEPVDSSEVMKRFGKGYYILRATKPRFRTLWKQQLGPHEANKGIHELDKRTKFLALGLAGTAVTEGLGFWLTHRRFRSAEDRLDKIETVLHALKPAILLCQNCGKSVDFFLQKYCGHCGSQIGWPSTELFVSGLNPGSRCRRCRLRLLEHHVYCPYCGETRFSQALYPLKLGTEFRVVDNGG